MVETPKQKHAYDTVKTTYADRAALAVMISAWITGGLPVLAKMLGYEFLPSQSWVGEARAVGYGFAIVVSLATAHFFFWSPTSEAQVRSAGRPWPAAWIRIGGVVLSAMLGNSALVIGLPLLQAAIIGKQISLTYVVENATGFSDSKCATEIELTSMPIGFDGACGFPEAFREQLQPGALIELHGRGTANGLFYDRIQIADPG